MIEESITTDDSAIPGPNAGNSPPWLNSIEAVSEIVRKFASDVVRHYGVVSHKDLMGWLSNECYQMNELFIGAGLADRVYSRGPWNTPDQLGHHLVLALGIDGELRFAVRDAFMIFASQIGALMRDHQAEDQFRALQRGLDAAVKKFAEQLLGTDEVTA